MKKTFLSFLSVFALALIATGILQGTAMAATWSDPVNLSGQTKRVDFLGVNNAGIINFSDAGVPSQYKARLVNKAANPTTQGQLVYEMVGWAWNDNLGWVSFYCDGVDHDSVTAGTQGQNLGAECGSQKYGVTLIYNTADQSLSFKRSAGDLTTSYAWNDATGYISMHNTNHTGAIQYGLRMDSNGTFRSDYPTAGIYSSDFAWVWSDSMKWMNFAGISGDLKIVNDLNCENKTYAGVCPVICNNGKTYCDEAIRNAPSTSYPIADGADYYTIRMNFKDVSNNPITQANLLANYDLRVFLKWSDTVKGNQVSGAVASSNLMYLKSPITDTTVNGGLLYKPVLIYNATKSTDGFLAAPATADLDTDNYDDIDTVVPGKVVWDTTDVNDLVLYVKSFAPTTAGNKSKVVSANANAFRDNDPGINGEKNNLRLESIQWVLKEIIPDRIIRGETNFSGSPLPLNFRPALTVDTLNTVSETATDDSNDTLVLYRNIPSMISIMARSFVTTGTTGVQPSRASSNIEFLLDNHSGEKFSVKTEIKESDGKSKIYPFQVTTPPTDEYQYNKWANRKMKLTPTLTGPSADEYTKGFKLKSVISYEAKVETEYADILYPVSYYGNFLPRKESPISNPVTVIQGSLYGTGSSPRADVTISEMGDNNTNIVKDTVYENIQKAVRDKTIPTRVTSVTIGDNFACNPSAACLTVPLYTSADGTTLEEMFYVNASKVILDNGASNITWTNNKVLVINGGNLFINSNLYNDSPSTAKLGIVVIRNQGDEIGLGGNIYISPNVTDIQALAVAWGTVFSYNGTDTSSIDSDNGEVPWTDENQMVETLKNQLVWKGGISSNNTIGGTDVNTEYLLTGYGVLDKLDSNGSIIENNLVKAKQYDLNYMRYFKLAVQYDENGNPWDTSCGKFLTPEELELTLDGDNSTDVYNGSTECDGIEPDEDLAPDPDAMRANGALPSENGPMYIKYAPPYSKSKIFGKEKTLTF